VEAGCRNFGRRQEGRAFGSLLPGNQASDAQKTVSQGREDADQIGCHSPGDNNRALPGGGEAQGVGEAPEQTEEGLGGEEHSPARNYGTAGDRETSDQEQHPLQGGKLSIAVGEEVEKAGSGARQPPSGYPGAQSPTDYLPFRIADLRTATGADPERD